MLGTARELPEEVRARFRTMMAPILVGFTASTLEEQDARFVRFFNFPSEHLRVVPGRRKGQRFLVMQLSTPAVLPVPSSAPNAQDKVDQSSDQRAWRRALRVAPRSPAKAARILGAEASVIVNKTSAEICAKLATLFPRSAHPPESRCTVPAESEMVLTDMDSVKAVILHGCSAKAPGMSGWTYELLSAVIADDILLLEVTSMVQALLNGRVGPGTLERIRCARGIAIPKGDSVRPIGIVEVLFNVAERICLIKVGLHGGPGVTTAADGALDPRQYGVGYSGGSEFVVHRTRTAVMNGKHVVTLDSRNAFNCPERSDILIGLLRHPCTRHLLPMFRILYGGEGPSAIFMVHHEPHRVACERGVFQGTVLGPLLFALACDLRDVWDRHPLVEAYVYMDDITLVADDVEALNLCVQDVQRALEARGISLNPTKCYHLAPVPPHSPVFGTLPVDVIKVLGAFLGPLELVRNAVTALMAHKHQLLWRRLTTGTGPCVLPILCRAGMSRFTYQMRVQAPAEIDEAILAYDDFVDRLTLAISQGAPATETSPQMWHLPIRCGGMGVQRLWWLRDILYAASRDVSHWDGVSLAPPTQRTRLQEHYKQITTHLQASGAFMQRLLHHNAGRGSSAWMFATDIPQQPTWFARRLCLRLGCSPLGTSVVCESIN